MDTFAAYTWLQEHVAEYGGDPTQVVLAGESAGANLVTALAVSMASQRPEAWARPAFDSVHMPKAVIAACGYLQLTELQRFREKLKISKFIEDRLVEVAEGYVGPPGHVPPNELVLADPLVEIERRTEWARPLPPFFAPCGNIDPLLGDTQRLDAALKKLGVPCEAPTYPGHHAFHAFVFFPGARRCWRDTFSFLKRYAPAQNNAV